MQDRPVRRIASACGRGQARRARTARGARRHRRRKKDRPRARRRDDPVLAPRTVAVRHRARRGDARQGCAPRHRPDASLSMTAAAPPLAAPVANARMYAVDAHVAALWKQLFAWVAEQAGVDLDVIEHPPPRPLPDLWRRNDLGCAFICGYPWVTWSERAVAQPQLLAA